MLILQIAKAYFLVVSSSPTLFRRKQRGSLWQRFAQREGMDVAIPSSILAEFQKHVSRLKAASEARKSAVALKNVVEDKQDRESTSVADTLGRRQPADVYEGDVNLRTLRSLLEIIDNSGWERSAHQLQFHSAFERCVARVLYKTEWATQRPAIMKHNSWEKANSEVLISTPRRASFTAFPCTSFQTLCLCMCLNPSGVLCLQTLRENIQVHYLSVCTPLKPMQLYQVELVVAQHCHLLRLSRLGHGMRNCHL